MTVWGPIIAILLSFQSGIPYSFYIDYRRVVFVALLIQMCAALAAAGTRSFRWAIGLAAFAAVQNPLWIVHVGVTWPWLLINAGTVVVSFMAMAHVHDTKSRVGRAGVMPHQPSRANKAAVPGAVLFAAMFVVLSTLVARAV